MRDRLLNESLTRLASEAAIKLSALVAGGDQIPYDVDAESGDDSLFYSYRPLTSLYVRERERLRGLDAFVARRAPKDFAPAVGPVGQHHRQVGLPRRCGVARAHCPLRSDSHVDTSSQG